MLTLEFAVRFLFGFGLFEGGKLAFGEDAAGERLCPAVMHDAYVVADTPVRR
jgi:hypothetical protein